MRRICLLLLLSLFVLSGLPAQAVDPGVFLARARAGAGSEELAELLNQGLSGPDGRESTWELLGLWHRCRWSTTPAARSTWQAFHSRFPESGYLPYADWFFARHLTANGADREAAGLLLRLVDNADTALAARSAGLLENLLLHRLDGRAEEDLAAAALTRDQVGWLNDQLVSRKLHKRIGVVLPLSGPDSEAGTQVRSGVEAAYRAVVKAPADQELLVLDCESDPVLAQSRMRSLAARVDAIITLGEPEYVAAAGFGSASPVLFPGYDGRPLDSVELSLYQFHADPALLAEAYCRLALDSLKVRHLVTFAPATLAGKRWAEALRARVQATDSLVEFGQAQWYFPGAQDMRHQLENMAIYENAFDSLGAALIFARDEDLRVMVPQLAWADPQHLVIANAPFLNGTELFELRSLDGQLLVIADWLPQTPVAEYRAWVQELSSREGRAPHPLEARGFETMRLLLNCSERAQREGRSFRATLESLRLPSLFGGELIMDGHRSAALRLLAWRGGDYRELDSSRLFLHLADKREELN